MKNSWLILISGAVGFALPAAAVAPADPVESGSAGRSSGFFAMDFEDHRDWSFDLGGGAMYLKPTGKVGFESTNLGNVIFGVRSLGLDREWTGWARAEWKFRKKHHLRFAFLPIDFDGDTFISVSLPKNDPVFTIGDRVDSEAKLYTYQLSYLYDFHLGKYVNISPSFTLGLIDAKIDIQDRTLGLGFHESQLVPLPEIGLRVEVFPCSRLSIFGEAEGFTIGDNATEWDASAGVKLFVNRHFYVEGTYRAIDYDVDWFDVVIDTRFHGPFIGGVLRF